MGAYLETGGTTARFWHETPNTTALTIEAYRRRRGWLAWTTATLSAAAGHADYPTLNAVMGIAEQQSDERRQTMLAHNLRLWRSVLNQKEAAGAA